MDDQSQQQVTIRRNFRGAKLMLVDDSLEQGALIRTVLGRCMPEVELLLATTGEQALSLLSQLSHVPGTLPRLILLDLYLPLREDGWRLLQRLKAPDSPYRLIPLTLLSHSSEPGDVETSYDLGANSYLVKPLDYPQWLTYFQTLRAYWWQTVTLPLHPFKEEKGFRHSS